MRQISAHRGLVLQTPTVSLIRPASDAGAAQWLLRGGTEWWDLVRYGPPGFEAYVRVAFAVDVDGEIEDQTSVPQVAITTLSAHTTTPDTAFAAVWAGWVNHPAPVAPRVLLPHRTMLLFTGPVTALWATPSLAWYGDAESFPPPHLAWPTDRAWCFACDVDEEIEFSVGCSAAAAHALEAALPGAVRRVRYGEPAPLSREPR